VQVRVRVGERAYLCNNKTTRIALGRRQMSDVRWLDGRGYAAIS
jgi:hypothetical protein